MPVNLPRTLLFSPRANETSHVLATAAYRRGLLTEHLVGWRVPDGFAVSGPVHLYAGPLFADAVAGTLGIGLLEPADSWLATLPREITRRDIVLTTMREAWQQRSPAFMKPPNDKAFPARVYRDGTQLPGPDAMDDNAPVLISDPVTFTAEFRLHVLDGAVTTASRYAIGGDLDIAPIETHPGHERVLDFAGELLAAHGATLPNAVVVDVGLIDGRPAVIEANAAWASGHYAADPDAVLDAVLRAAGPLAEVADGDRRFLRPAVFVED